MPRGNGTGPMGMGAMTGRGQGYCAGNNTPGAVNGGGWTGQGRGSGMGFARGCRGAGGGGRGMGRALYFIERTITVRRTSAYNGKKG